MQSTPPHEYRISLELRRCCWYVIFSVVLFAPLFFGVARFAQNRNAWEIAFGFAFFGLVAAVMGIALRWRVRVDEAGVARRLFGRWDFWSWADLASGRICKRHPFTLYDPLRPWWRRTLKLEFLDSDDTQEVFTRINQHYQLPPAPELPDILKIVYGFRRTAIFDRNGVQLLIRNTPSQYLWNEIYEVQITRMEPLRRDFQKLVMTLPDQELEFKLVTHQYGTSPTWRGATAEVLNEFLRQYVLQDRLHVSVAGQKLTERKQIEKKLTELQKNIRYSKRLLAFFATSLLAIFVLFATQNGVMHALAMCLTFIICPGSLGYFLYRIQRKEASKLIEALDNATDAKG